MNCTVVHTQGWNRWNVWRTYYVTRLLPSSFNCIIYIKKITTCPFFTFYFLLLLKNLKLKHLIFVANFLFYEEWKFWNILKHTFEHRNTCTCTNKSLTENCGSCFWSPEHTTRRAPSTMRGIKRNRFQHCQNHCHQRNHHLLSIDENVLPFLGLPLYLPLFC